MSPEALLYSIYIVDLYMLSHYSICLYPHRPRQKKPKVENIDIDLEILNELHREPEAPLKPEFDEDDLFGQTCSKESCFVSTVPRTPGFIDG